MSGHLAWFQGTFQAVPLLLILFSLLPTVHAFYGVAATVENSCSETIDVTFSTGDTYTVLPGGSETVGLCDSWCTDTIGSY